MRHPTTMTETRCFRLERRHGWQGAVMPEGHLVFHPAYESGFTAEFGYDDRKGVGPCDRGPSGLGRRKRKNRPLVPLKRHPRTEDAFGAIVRIFH
ncbi:MAG: hypothetical protein P4L59_06470 [Desulfosporosinus sp.]|nr:hypothetical protein [Desulfosporosinus sp.]